MKNNKSTIIIFLLLVCILLLCVDIYTGIKIHFSGDAMSFYNVATLVISIIVGIIYYSALRKANKQNRILLSQNLKPHYEAEIKEYLINGQEVEIILEINSLKNKYNALNYTFAIYQLYIELSRNSDFIKVMAEITLLKNTFADELQKFTYKSYFFEKQYFNSIEWFSELTLDGNRIELLCNKLSHLMREIKQSSLIEEDKKLLIQSINRKFLEVNLKGIEKLTKDCCWFPIIPVFDKHDKVEFRKFSELNFTAGIEDLLNNMKQTPN